MSKWTSEEVRRSALDEQLRRLRESERPGFILYHHSVLDEDYTEKYRRKLRSRIERIRAAGEPHWQHDEKP